MSININTTGNFNDGFFSVKIGDEVVLEVKLKELSQVSDLFQEELNYEFNQAFRRVYELGRLGALNDVISTINQLK